MDVSGLRRRLLLPAVLVAATGCSQMVTVQPVATLELPAPEETSVVLADDGSVLAELHAEQDRDVVPLDRIPSTLRDAIVAVEDARFYEHPGLDLRGIGRAVVRNVSAADMVEGGSTITQQLAKNAIVGADATLHRKMTEASVALQLEARLTKDEILEHYLNIVYFGHGAYGVQTAARRYFDVDVADLSLAQSATLAGVLHAPGSYDAAADADALRNRRDEVLRRMAEQDLADVDAVATAHAEPLGVVTSPDPEHWNAPYFVAHTLAQLQHDPAFGALGDDPATRADRLYRGGLTIETTLDTRWQEAAEHAVATTLRDPGGPHAAVVAIDPATGGIRALVGGRDWDDGDSPTARFNLATDGARQPGSTFKPLVLATALREGHTLDEVFPGGSTVTIPMPGEDWHVRNYGNQDLGPLSLSGATTFSANTVYARLVDDVGPEAVVDTARAAGIRRGLDPFHSVALGAQEVSVLEMASVQATLAAGGVYRRPSAVTRITAADGRVLYERGETPGQRVLHPAVAWLTTTALEDVIAHGTGEDAGIGRPLAGKTGTSQDGADAWFTGYTPDLAAAVWIGFPQGRVAMVPPRTPIRVEGGNWPAQLFARFGVRALAGVTARDFPVPAGSLRTVVVHATDGCIAIGDTPAEVRERRSYLPGTEPTAHCEPAPAPVPIPVPTPVPAPGGPEPGGEPGADPESSGEQQPGGDASGEPEPAPDGGVGP